MAQWKVQYRGADKKTLVAIVKAPDQYKTAKQVQEALQDGEIEDLYVEVGAIISVEKYTPGGLA